jgi:hypothetical protein
MIRILLANFVVQGLPLLMITAAIVLILKARAGGPGSNFKHYLGLCLGALPAGIIVYIFAGILAARLRAEGHFYSVPFGGYTVSNNAAIGLSILIWIALVFAVLAFLLRPHR